MASYIDASHRLRRSQNHWEDSDDSSFSETEIEVRPRTRYRTHLSGSPRREAWASSHTTRSRSRVPGYVNYVSPEIPRSSRSFEDGEAPKDSEYLVPLETRKPSRPVSVHWKPKDSGDSKSQDPIANTVDSSKSHVNLERKDFDGVMRTGEEGKDITIHLDLPASLDLSDELAHLSRLNRLGHFKAGISFFESRLAQHVDFFPVVAEYADLLFRQGAFGNASDFIHERRHDPSVAYSRNDMMLLELHECAANVYTKGALLPALEMAKTVLRPREDQDELEDHDQKDPAGNSSRVKVETYSPTTVGHTLKDAPSSEKLDEREVDPKGATRVHKRSWFHSSIGVRIQMIDLCLEIISRAHGLSSYLETDQYRPLLNWGVAGEDLISQRSQTSTSRPSSSRHDRRRRRRSPSPDRRQRHGDRLSIRARSSRSPPDSNSSSSSDSDSGDSDSQRSWKPDLEPKVPLLGPWYDILVEKGYHWESHRLLSHMLILVQDDYGCYPLDGSFERTFGLKDLQSAFDKFCGHSLDDLKDEQILLTCFANATMLTGYLNVPFEDRVLAVQKKFHEKAKSLASKIFTTHPGLMNSKPYIIWVQSEANPSPLFCDEPKRQLQKRKAPRLKLSSDSRDYTNVQTPSNNTKNHHQTGSSADSWERTLELLYTSASLLGDLSTRYNLLKRLIRVSGYGEKSLKRIHDLFSLCYEETNDSIAHAFCLEDEVQLLHNIKLEDGLLDLEGMRRDLYFRFKDFDELFPSHFESSPYYSNHREKGVTFFDIPAASSSKVQALRQLLLDIDRPVGARLSSSKTNTPIIDVHLPRKGPYDRYQYRCSSCGYCDPMAEDIQEHHPGFDLEPIRPSEIRRRNYYERSRPPPQVTMVNDKAEGSQKGSTSRIYQSTRPRRQTLSLDKEPEVSQEVGDINDMLPERMRAKVRTYQRTPRRTKTPYDSMSTLATQSFTPPPRIRRTSPIPPDESPTTDSIFSVPYKGFKSFEELKSHVRDLYRDEEERWPYIKNGSYELMAFDGVLLTESNWKENNRVSPGAHLSLILLEMPAEDDTKDQEETESTQPRGPLIENAEDVPHAESDIEPQSHSEPNEDDSSEEVS